MWFQLMLRLLLKDAIKIFFSGKEWNHALEIKQLSDYSVKCEICSFCDNLWSSFAATKLPTLVVVIILRGECTYYLMKKGKLLHLGGLVLLLN